MPEDGKWTVAQLVEHISIVEDGMTRICAKLLNEAVEAGKSADGSVKMSDDFLRKAEGSREQKLEAPDRVHPKSNQTIAESLAKMEESRNRLNKLRPLFESVECSDQKFPHPAFGELTAHEWLALVGGHEMRHIAQIKRVLK